MTTINFITDLFCRVDDEMKETKKHSQIVMEKKGLTIDEVAAQFDVGSASVSR